MNKKYWDENKVALLKALSENPNLTQLEIANKMNTTYDAIDHAQRRYGIKQVIEEKQKEKTRWSNSEILEEVQYYIEAIRNTSFKYNDIYKDIKYKGTWNSVKQTEDQVQLFSDMHTGMINIAPITGDITYNKEIQEKELQNLLKGNQRFYQLYKPAYNIETFYIFGLGDNITNDRIYEGQKSEITCTVGNQIKLTFEYLSDYIKHLLKIYPRVVYINIVGNHSRTTNTYTSESAVDGFEHYIGLLLQERFKDNKRVEIINPEDYAYTLQIRGHRYLLTHGNSIRGAALNSIEKAVKEIALLVEQEPYDCITVGHFHSCYEFPISPKTTLLVNGCWIYNDNYAYEKLHKFSTAKQFLFNVSKRSALHSVQKIDLRWDMK
jgi:hypothetical protein